MKIVIEFDNSYNAKLTIDDKQMHVSTVSGLVELIGVKGPVDFDTVGGVVANQLYTKISECQQAWATVAEELPDVKTWDKLDEEIVDAAEGCFW